MDEEDMFELEYDDELDALRQLEEELEDEVKPKSRKTLQFSTPGDKNVDSRVDAVPSNNRTSNGNISNKNLTTKNGYSEIGVVEFDKLSEESFATPLDDSFNQSLTELRKKRTASEDSETAEIYSINGSPELCNVVKKTKISRSPDVEKQQRELEKQAVRPSSNVLSQNRIHPTSVNINRGVSRSVPLTTDFFSVTTSGGRRAYVTLRSQESLILESERISTASRSLALLNVPLYALRAQLDEKARAAESQNRVCDNTQIDLMVHDAAEEAGQDSRLHSDGLEGNGRQCNRLWVDEYAPAQYTELISEEVTNRMLLRWLKLWDHVVFGVDLKNTVAKSAANKNDKSSAMGKDNKKFEPKFQKFPADDLFELDKNNIPKYKVVLVSGPPGLGKTTLAHIIARHAGYNVVEMNASDDRTVDAFKEKIMAATQMKSVLGASPRPNCLVIDEIDGAIQPAINVLLTLIKGAQTVTDTTKNTKKKSQQDTLQRPIICICNDLYATSLRQLRQVALVVSFHTSTSSSHRLASRLMEISRREGLKAELPTLMALCEKTDSDIRSCINTLQFSKARRGELSLQMVHSMSLGQKDVQRSLFSAWQQIFTMPKPKKQRWVNPYDRAENMEQAEQLAAYLSQSETSAKTRFQKMLQVAYATGEDNKVQQGLFENYLEVKVKDPHMNLLVRAVDWLGFSDTVNQIIGHTQNYSLGIYLPFIPVTFHFLFASNHPPKIIYPHSQYEVLTKTSAAESLLSAMLGEMAPPIRSTMTHRQLVLELLPQLIDVIQPTLRPVNTQLYSNREKAELAQLIRVMIGYNLTYQQQRNLDGQYTYRLEPNVEELTRFSDIKSTRFLTYAAKQLISREIELEKLRRSNARADSLSGTSGGTEAKKSSGGVEQGGVANKNPLPNHLRQTLQPKHIVSEVKPAVDFFGRRIQKPIGEKSEDANKKSDDAIGGDIWFRFKEGFTNAVRKTVRVQDFF